MIIAFEGGPRDGRVGGGESRDPVITEPAISFFIMSGNGTIGKRVKSATPFSLKDMRSSTGPSQLVSMCHYEVVHRREADGLTIVTLGWLASLQASRKLRR